MFGVFQCPGRAAGCESSCHPVPPRAGACRRCCNHRDSPDADGNLGATWRCRWLIPARRWKQPRPNQRGSTSGRGRSRRQNCSWKEMKGWGGAWARPPPLPQRAGLRRAAQTLVGSPSPCHQQHRGDGTGQGLLTPRAGMSQLVHFLVSPPPQGA